MIKHTIWKPDTCECKIDYEWDDSLSEAERIHTVSNIIKQCPAHTSGTTEDKFNAVLDENKRKNITLKTMRDNISELVETDSSGVINFKKGITVNWEFDENRILNVSVSGYNLTQQQKDTLTTLAETKFGINKVIFV